MFGDFSIETISRGSDDLFSQPHPSILKMCQKWFNNLQIVLMRKEEAQLSIILLAFKVQWTFLILIRVCIMRAPVFCVAQWKTKNRTIYAAEGEKNSTVFFSRNETKTQKTFVPHGRSDESKRCVGANDSRELAGKMRGNRWSVYGLSLIDRILAIKSSFSGSLMPRGFSVKQRTRVFRLGDFLQAFRIIRIFD